MVIDAPDRSEPCGRVDTKREENGDLETEREDYTSIPTCVGTRKRGFVEHSNVRMCAQLRGRVMAVIFLLYCNYTNTAAIFFEGSMPSIVIADSAIMPLCKGHSRGLWWKYDIRSVQVCCLHTRTRRQSENMILAYVRSVWVLLRGRVDRSSDGALEVATHRNEHGWVACTHATKR